MAKIYSIPDEVKAPKLDFNNVKAWQEDEKRFMSEIEAFVKNYNPNGGEHIGKTIQFPVADSYAVYMVASMKPLELIHLPIGDAWHFEIASSLRASDVLLKIQQAEGLAKMLEENKLRQLENKN